jgi:tRNA pseudouridine(38-40) synthase
MPRYKIIVEYDGAPFVGWQLQENGLSVQGALMAAIAAFSGEKVMVQGAGRTDAGVHAIGQVAHFDLAIERGTDTVRDAINAHLRPHPVAVLSAEKVAADLTRGARRCAATISTASATAVPIWPSSAAAPGVCRGGSMRMRCTPPRSG